MRLGIESRALKRVALMRKHPQVIGLINKGSLKIEFKMGYMKDKRVSL